MGLKASDPIDLAGDQLESYLRANHSVYMELDGKTYYLTDVNDHYWRVQDTETLNDKGHYVDLSEPVPTVSDFMTSPAFDGLTLEQVRGEAAFFPSVKPEE